MIIVRGVFCLFVFLINPLAWGKTQLIDLAGRSVEIPGEVKKVVLGEGRLFYAVALLEGEKPFARIAGWQGDFRKLDPQTYALYQQKFPEIDEVPLIGGTTANSVSYEKLIAIGADLVIFSMTGNHGPGRESTVVSQLEKAGVPVVFVDFRASPLRDTIPSMRILGQALQRETQAEAYIQFYQQQLQKVTSFTQSLKKTDKPKVFIELKAGTTNSCCGTAGNGNMGDFIDVAGGENIAKGVLPTALGNINLEKVLSSDPDIYIATGSKSAQAKEPGLKFGALVTPVISRESLEITLQRTGINSLRAVTGQRTYGIWHFFYNSPYNILAIQQLAKWFHPEDLSALEPEQTMQQLYQQFLPINVQGTYWISNDITKAKE